MKIFNSFISQRFRLLALTTISLLSFSYNIHAQDEPVGDATAGEALFKANCASCHKPDEDMTGPGLQGARQRWIDNSSEENFYAWVKNSQGVIKSGDGYAASLFAEWNKTIMTPQAVTNQQIDDIFAYVESYVPPTGGPLTGGEEISEVNEESNDTVWWIVGILLIIVIGAVGTSRGYLAKVAKIEAGEAVNEKETVGQAARSWAWNNRGWFGVMTLIVVVALMVSVMMDLMKIGLFEDYKPEQPIEYSHK